jgi:hypothetical protein
METEFNNSKKQVVSNRENLESLEDEFVKFKKKFRRMVINADSTRGEVDERNAQLFVAIDGE